MAWHYIEYKEIATAYFAVEADDPDEALRRFDQWRIDDDHVYNTMSSTDNYDSTAVVVPESDCGGLDDDDMLSEAAYEEL